MVATHPRARGGVASYTWKLIRALRRHFRVDLLASTPDPAAPTLRGVDACWQPGLRYPFQVFQGLCRLRPDVVHVQHEVFLYGRLLAAALFPLLLLLARLRAAPVVVTLHGVIPLSHVDRQFLTVNGITGPRSAFKAGLAALTRAIVRLADAVVVHDDFFAATLRREYGCPAAKIRVIPHGVDAPPATLPRDAAKARLGLPRRTVVLFFGNIARYKGIETLIRGFQHTAPDRPDRVLVIAGGTHRRLERRPSYQRYVAMLRAQGGAQVRFIGFVPEGEVSTYFAAADVLVLPYVVSMSSSGPFALALSHGTPVIASDVPPFNRALPPTHLFRKGSPRALGETLEAILAEPHRGGLAPHLARLRRDHAWSTIGARTAHLYATLTR
jgi:glycosyltransferase involved in cell wall biosynthesis